MGDSFRFSVLTLNGLVSKPCGQKNTHGITITAHLEGKRIIAWILCSAGYVNGSFLFVLLGASLDTKLMDVKIFLGKLDLE
jgi:hypothetical protein